MVYRIKRDQKYSPGLIVRGFRAIGDFFDDAYFYFMKGDDQPVAELPPIGGVRAANESSLVSDKLKLE